MMTVRYCDLLLHSKVVVPTKKPGGEDTNFFHWDLHWREDAAAGGEDSTSLLLRLEGECAWLALGKFKIVVNINFEG
jgi:hypothetical protein